MAQMIPGISSAEAMFDFTTLNLAASGINPIQIQHVHSFSDYVEPLINFLGSLPPKKRVILVGHSMGGAVISIAMEMFPEKIAPAVYATAFMPGPALSYFIFEKDLTLALSLVRFYPLLNEEIKLTENKYGFVQKREQVWIGSKSVHRIFVCDQDHAIKENVQMWMIRKNPPNELKVINGSDHMVMFSRPLELFSNLLKVAEKYS